MREIDVALLRSAVAQMFMEANYFIGSDIEKAVCSAAETEPSPAGKAVLEQIKENYRIARDEKVAICQDTGMAVLFMEIGQDVHFVGGSFEEAVQNGVRDAYRDGFLRKSVVDDPLFDRVNTKDNTPAIIHTRITEGDKVHILATPKGFGSENMSRVKMLVPADGVQGVKDFVLDAVRQAGPNPCPPVILGLGIGGTLEKAAELAKKATARPIDTFNADARYAALERELLDEINALGIGPAGIGGRTTALKVNIEYFPTHIAGMPVALNVCCHCARHSERTI